MYSTVTALLESTDSSAYIIDHGMANAVVFLDLKRLIRSTTGLFSLNYITSVYTMRPIFGLCRT